MRLCRFNDQRLGVVRDDRVIDVTAALDELPAYRYPLPTFDPFIAELPRLCPRIESLATGEGVPLHQVKLLSPLANPGKIVAAPVNYRKHLEEARADPAIHHQLQVAEIEQVGLFLKATSSIIGAGEEFLLRHPERRTDHEIELVAVIGKRVTGALSPAAALSHVAGYCIGLDMTLRGPEERSFRKSIDTYTVLGPYLVTADEIGDPSSLELELTVNGEPRQAANTRDLIIGVAELLSFASSFYTLEVGDVIFTGTPQGVGQVRPGDLIHASITGLGAMELRVGAERSGPSG